MQKLHLKEVLKTAGNFEQAKAQSVRCFYKVVMPVLREQLYPRYTIISAESDKSAISKVLDIYAGVDFLLVDKEKHTVDGVASRIQITDTPFDTFTVRFKRDSREPTEYDKRIMAMRRKSLFPKYTFQAYVSPDMKPLSMAFVETSDLFKYIESNALNIFHTGTEQIGQTSFIVVKWSDLRNAGAKINILE